MGRGWHHGKRGTARMPACRESPGFPRPGTKSRETRVILIRHGQTEFNRVFSIGGDDPGLRDPH